MCTYTNYSYPDVKTTLWQLARVSLESGIILYRMIIGSLVIKGYLKMQNRSTLPLYYFLI